MVTTSLPATDDTGTLHERTASPPTTTVHEPQNPSPHPYLVPVRPRSVRSTHSRVRSPSVSIVVGLPFRRNRMVFVMPPPFRPAEIATPNRSPGSGPEQSPATVR